MGKTSTLAEISYCQEAAQRLRSAGWAQQLMGRLNDSGGLDSPDSRPYLFELRVAVELSKSNKVTYEYAAGVGNTTVEFRVDSKPEWLIELVSLGLSTPVLNATKHCGDGSWSRELSSDADDCRQTEEREMVLAQEKILQKVFDRQRQRPVKFPEVLPDRFHAIMVDMRGYLGDGDGDEIDFAQMAYGPQGVPKDLRQFVHNWPPRVGPPIPGLFENRNKLDGAPILQQRIHFLVFVNEKVFGPGKMGIQLRWAGNPNLFSNSRQAESVFAMFPVRHPTSRLSFRYSFVRLWARLTSAFRRTPR